MRVTCNSLAEFLTNLRDDSLIVLFGVVYFSTDRRAMDEGNPRDSVRYEVSAQASAVIRSNDGEAEYLLECGEPCGMDWCDTSNSRDGSKYADQLGKKLKDFCDDRGLKVRPGVVGI